MQGIEDVQSRLVMDERTSFLENKGGIYQRAITLALKRDEVDQALIYVEKAKSRVLGDYLRQNIDVRLRAGDQAGEAILQDLERLREEQAWFSTIVYDMEDVHNLSDTAVMRMRAVGPVRARQEMQQRERQIERLLEQMHLRSVGDLVSQQRSSWTDSIVTSLAGKLPASTLLLEYYFSDRDIYIFQMTISGITVQVVPDAYPKMERLLSLWRANLELAAQAAGSPDRVKAFAGLQENCLGLLRRLYDLLLRPVSEALTGCDHMIIVPYGVLHYLPFHCLFDGDQFLVERFNISYLPSAALMDICYQRGQRMQAKGCASLSTRACLRSGVTSSRGRSVIACSGQVVAHSPHCTQLRSTKRSCGRSLLSCSALAGQAPTQLRHSVHLSLSTSTVPKGAPAGKAIASGRFGACSTRWSSARSSVVRFSAPTA